jgi:hypothetical protein
METTRCPWQASVAPSSDLRHIRPQCHTQISALLKGQCLSALECLGWNGWERAALVDPEGVEGRLILY